MPEGQVRRWTTPILKAFGFARRAELPPSAVIALTAGVLAFAPTPSAGESLKTPGSGSGIVLFGVAPSDVAPFFQRTRCIVGRVRDVARKSGTLTATIIYPSGNYGLDGRRTTVLYSHILRLLEPAHPDRKLDKIDLARNALILVRAEGPGLVYRVVGVAAMPTKGKGGLGWDYFADKPALWFRGNQAR